MTDKKVQTILRDRRKELGYTMKEIADMVGVSEATISRWESGDIANMRRDRIAKLAKALRLSPSVIMGWDDDLKNGQQEEYYIDPAVATKTQEIFDDPDLQILLDAKRDLSADDLDVVLNMIKALKAKEEK